jgi:hypothetical protein
VGQKSKEKESTQESRERKEKRKKGVRESHVGRLVTKRKGQRDAYLTKQTKTSECIQVQ